MSNSGKSDNAANSIPDPHQPNQQEVWTDAIMEAQSEIIEMITRGEDLHLILRTITQLVENNSDDELYASILLAGTGNTLITGAAPGLPDAFNEIINGNGSCGTAAYLKVPVIIENTATDPRCAKYRDVTRRFGIAACWSTPLLTKNREVAGTFTLYHKKPKAPTARDLQIIRLISSTAMLAIRYTQTDDERNALPEREKREYEKAGSAELLVQMALESSRVGTFHIDLATDTILYSPLLSTIITGEMIETIERSIFAKHIHPEDAIIRNKAFEQALGNGHLEYEARFIWNNGSIHWIKALGTYHFDANGQPLTFSGTVCDITEEKNKQSELQALQNRFQSIFQHASLGIAMTDLQGNFTLANKAYTKIVGYDEEELYGLSIKQISHPEDWARKKGLLDQLLQGHMREFEINKRYTHKNGQQVWVRNNVSIIHDAGGRPQNLVVISEDITAQNEWKQEQQKLRKLVDNSVDLMSILGLNGRNTYINKAGMEMLGFDTQEQVNETPLSMLHSPADFEKVQREVLPTVMETGRWAGSMIVKNMKTGERFPVFNHCMRIDHPLTGVPMAVGAVMRDMRPEMKARKEQQKLIALLEKSSDFVSLSHLNGQVHYVNEAGRKMLGIDTREELERHNSEYLAPHQLEKLEDEVTRQMEETGRWSGEIVYRHFKTGEEIPVFDNTMMVYDEFNGAPIGRATISRDLRQEKAFHKAITESEQRFRNMVEQAPVAIGVLKGPTFIIETVNDALLQLWGKSRSAIGKPMLEALPELVSQPFPKLMLRVFETGIPYYGFQTPAMLKKDGKLDTFYFNFIYAPFIENGAVTGIQILASDVTEQVKVHKELQASEERFRSFISSAPTPIGVYTGREMRIQIVNDAILKTWDRDSSVIGKTFSEALPEMEGQPFAQLLDDVYTTGITYTASEAPVSLLVNGRLQQFYFNFTYKPIRDGKGEVYGVINTATDVTALVLGRKQLMETQERLRLAVESAEMATWSINIQNGEVHFSQRARDWYGFAGETINMYDGFNAIHPEDRERAVSNMQQALDPAREGFYEDEYRVVNLQTKVLRVLRVSGRVIFNEQQEAVLLTGIVHDITRQKMQEQELENMVQQRTIELQQANIQLKQTNEELEQYAYVASHDLQEPLRKIRMFSSMLKDHPAITGNEYTQRHMEKIDASATRMSLLIKDLLEFSRVNAEGELFTTVSLDTIVASVEQDFELLIQQKQAVIVKDVLPSITAIPLQMNQLFYNLLGNALKFTAPGEAPQVTITSQPATPALLATHEMPSGKSYYHITIADQGIGFDSFLKEKIFTIFQRLNTRDQYEGTGIGLALCRKIVLSHGGFIWAEGESGQGAKFHLLLPA